MSIKTPATISAPGSSSGTNADTMIIAASPTAPSNIWYVLLILFLINLLNFFDRTIPAVVLEPIRKEFGLDDTALGLLGTSFTLVYALAGIPLGRLADRSKRTTILAGGVLMWSVMTGASGLAWSFMSFFIIRMGVGIGEASCAPAANAMIGDLFPSEKRARALGIFMLGLPLGLLLCYLLVGVIAQKYGWRVPFYIAAVPGFLVALLAYFLREPVRGAQENQRGAQKNMPLDSLKKIDEPIERPFRKILAIPTIWWIIASGATVNFASYAMNTFLATMLIRYHGVSIAQAGLLSALVLGVTGLIGLIAGGVLADRMHARHPRGRLMFAAIAMLMAAPFLYVGLTQPVGELKLMTAFLFIGWMLFFVYYVSVYPALQDVVQPRLRATAMAVYFFFQYVLGAAFGTLITGALSDYFARQAMFTAHAAAITDAFRATGLHAAMSVVIPLALLLTGLALWGAALSFVADARAMQQAASASESTPAPAS